MEKWKFKTLGEIAEVQSGGTPLRSRKEYWSGEISWYSSGELNETFTQSSKDFITQMGLEESNAKLFPKGSLLIGMYDTAALKMSILDRDAAFNQAIAGVKVNKNVDLKFILYAINSKRFEILNQRRGVRQKNLSLAKIKDITLPVLSLIEQKRIVSIVDEAFEAIDIAIDNTKQNLTNARELFDSYLNAIFTQKGDGWKEKKLDEIGGKVSTGPFGSLLHKSDYISGGIPIVNPANIEENKIIPNFNKTISPDIAERMHAYILKENDVVVGRRGEIGRCAVVGDEEAGWLCGSGSFFINPFENVNPIFLAHLIRSVPYRSKLEELASGATMLNLSNQSLSDLIIAMPSLDEQNQITNRLDDLRTETQRLEAIYQQKFAALNELKQSILHKAFTGELTADKADLKTNIEQEAIAV
jgi:type I restriction enzyme, S subunit